MNQIAFKFDKETIKKIGKAAFIAIQYGLAVAALAVLEKILTVDLGVWTPIITSLVPFGIEFVRQWAKGKKEELEK